MIGIYRPILHILEKCVTRNHFIFVSEGTIEETKLGRKLGELYIQKYLILKKTIQKNKLESEVLKEMEEYNEKFRK